MIYSLMALVFVLGYIAIALEHNLHVDKAASALLTAIIVWTLLVFGADTLLTEHIVEGHGATEFLNIELRHHLAEISEILFFLMGAMFIVELVDAHQGFDTITRRIQTTKAVNLIWIIGILTFFLSAVLDNLTTTIVMVSLLRKIIADKQTRLWFAGMVILCANAGGAWSPIGAVTTTMLWIGTQITAKHMIIELFLPSLVAAIVPLCILTFIFKGQQIARPTDNQATVASSSVACVNNSHMGTLETQHDLYIDTTNHTHINTGTDATQPTTVSTDYQLSQNIMIRRRTTVLALGLGALAFVPVFKTVTHLPPYMGILFGMSILWLYTEIKNRNVQIINEDKVTIVSVLQRVDMPSILFFLGILLAVSALATAGHLTDVATWLDATFGNLYVINVLIGLISALVDNVPLVAGAMKMYPLLDPAAVEGLSGAELTRQSQFFQDGDFWHFLAYCAGTGGSCLIIGSAAGVAAMGMEKIPFMWYLKRISGLALAGYLAGAATYMALNAL